MSGDRQDRRCCRHMSEKLGRAGGTVSGRLDRSVDWRYDNGRWDSNAVVMSAFGRGSVLD